MKTLFLLVGISLLYTGAYAADNVSPNPSIESDWNNSNLNNPNVDSNLNTIPDINPIPDPNMIPNPNTIPNPNPIPNPKNITTPPDTSHNPFNK